MGGLKDTLRETLRKMAQRTSVDSLRKKGVRQVNVLGIDRIAALIEAAVHSSLKTRLVGFEREAVAEATKAEFMRLLRSNEDLQRQKTEAERLTEQAAEEIDQLRRELSRHTEALQLKLDQGALGDTTRHQGEDAAIVRTVREVVSTLAQTPGTTATELERRLLELVMTVVAGERRTADEARRALHDREVDNLQRRIKKLNDNLVVTEHRLQQATAHAVDAGISSVYREVQGLQAGDVLVDRKRELMADIFQANLKLQRKLADRA